MPETAENLGEIDQLAEKLHARRFGRAQAHGARHRGRRRHHADRVDARAAIWRRRRAWSWSTSRRPRRRLQAVSVDPVAPGIAELMQGAASFSQVITRDRLSRVHLVTAGRPGFDRSLLQSPRLALAIDALLRVYDHVLLNAGLASDLPAELLTAKARAIVVPDACNGGRCAPADVRAARGGGLFRGDDAEQAGAAVPSDRCHAESGRGLRPPPQRSAFRRPSASQSKDGLCFTRCLPRAADDIAAAASRPRPLSGTKLSNSGSSRLQNSRL